MSVEITLPLSDEFPALNDMSFQADLVNAGVIINKRRLLPQTIMDKFCFKYETGRHADQSLVLLSLLSLYEGFMVPADSLTKALYPCDDIQRGKENLRNRVYFLRKKFPKAPKIFCKSGIGYGFNIDRFTLTGQTLKLLYILWQTKGAYISKEELVEQFDGGIEPQLALPLMYQHMCVLNSQLEATGFNIGKTPKPKVMYRLQREGGWVY